MLRSVYIAAAGLALAATIGVSAPALAKAQLEPKDVHWPNQGMFGHFDQAQLQRGFKVYSEVCSSCHSMSLMSYRNLAQPDGPFYNKSYPNPNESPYAKAIAAEVKVPGKCRLESRCA